MQAMKAMKATRRAPGRVAAAGVEGRSGSCGVQLWVGFTPQGLRVFDIVSLMGLQVEDL
jgi:hypothetical protein